MTRRRLLEGLLSGGIWSALQGRLSAGEPASMGEVAALQQNWRALLPEGMTVPLPREKLKLSTDEWRKRLAPDQFYVLREEGTERPGSSPLNYEKRPGVFTCAGCGLAVFTSEMKYDSGTGWPSFFVTIPGVFETRTDFKLIFPRTEYHCTRCGGHHGHVFSDGPRPTGKRWCNNGLALEFIPQSAKT